MQSGTEEPWNPSGVVSLLTDFGLEDPYVGIMKGVLHERRPGLAVVDLTHAVPPQDTLTAAWFLRHGWHWFPAGTVHVAVVDPGVGSGRDILCAMHRGHAFLAPDNGLLGPVLGSGARAFRVDAGRFARGTPSRTFHGRDVFAPAAAALAGGLAPREVGPEVDGWARLQFPPPRRNGDEIRTEVVVVDRFGNLITGLVPEELDLELSGWEVVLGGQRLPLDGTYADVEVGQVLALVDSYGHLELAVRDGSAAERLGLGRGAQIHLRRRT